MVASTRTPGREMTESLGRYDAESAPFESIVLRELRNSMTGIVEV